MYAPVIGSLNEYECAKCGSGVRWLLPFSFAHDIRCWSLSTALYNAYVRVFRPRYFLEECTSVDEDGNALHYRSVAED